MTYRDHPVTDYCSVVDDDTQFVDVREPAEYASGTIVGAINIPLGDLPERIADLDTNHRVVLLCRSGNRSAQAARHLDDAGFCDVVNLDGGMISHTQEEQP